MTGRLIAGQQEAGAERKECLVRLETGITELQQLQEGFDLLHAHADVMQTFRVAVLAEFFQLRGQCLELVVCVFLQRFHTSISQPGGKIPPSSIRHHDVAYVRC